MEFDKTTNMAILTNHEAECSGLAAGIPVALSAELLDQLVEQSVLAESITSKPYRPIARGISTVLRNMRDQYNAVNQ